MPAKGSVLMYGNRDYVFNTDFYKNVLQKEKKVEFDYKQCKNIIDHSNKIIADIIKTEVDGFKLPFGFGYLCPVKYVPAKPMINWKETNKIGKRVYFTNMHTEGFSCRVQWFRVGRITNMNFNEVYKFKSYKTLSNAVSKAFAAGKTYVEWSVSDFMEKSRLENLYNKKYRKELKQ